MSRQTITLTGALLLTVAASVLAPPPARGQFAQYTQPGTVSRGGPEVTRQDFEAALADAPWNLGPVRLDPWIGLRNVGWSANPVGAPEGSEAEDGEVTASGGAGLRAHLPTGHSVFWTAHALPEYQWWADHDDRNRLNGRYGAGVFAFLNRVTFEASGRRVEALGVVSAELPQEVSNRRDLYRLASQVELGFATSLFAEVAETRIRNVLEDDAGFDSRLRTLDRDERRLRTGLRYSPRERWSLGAGVEWTESESAGARDLSSSGTAPLVEVLYSGPKFWASAGAELRSLEADGGSEFRDTDTETYSLTLGVDGNRLSPVVYARRSLVLSVSEDFSHFASETYGASLALALGRRIQVRGFGETGESEYVAREGAVAPARLDDVTSYGAEVTFRIGRRLAARVGGYHTEFDSNLPGEDRTLEVLTTGVTLGFGDSGSGWL